MNEQMKENKKMVEVSIEEILVALFRTKTDEEISEIIDKFIRERHSI